MKNLFYLAGAAFFLVLSWAIVTEIPRFEEHAVQKNAADWEVAHGTTRSADLLARIADKYAPLMAQAEGLSGVQETCIAKWDSGRGCHE